MARTIEQIKSDIITRLSGNLSLSDSAVAEWKLWVHCFAYTIYVFEIVMDKFRKEVQDAADELVVGTLSWYNNKCYEYQDGHQLVFNQITGLLDYPEYEERARIIKIAAVNAENGTLHFRVATQNNAGEVVPITDMQMVNFKNYIDAIKFAGTRSMVISTSGDQVRYSLRVYYDPATPVNMVEKNVRDSLVEFKTSQRFGGVVYRHRFMEAVTSSNGVVTAKLNTFQRKATDETDFGDIDSFSYLYAGYFNYTDDSEIEFISINDIVG